MADESTGKWVARAASTGGGRTYRGQAPVNWYLSLVLIVIIGVSLIAYSRYEKAHPVNAGAGQPAVGTTWHAAEGIDICGALQANLPSNTSQTTTGLTTDGSGVITVAPKNSSESGSNATLGKFVSEYKGLTLTVGSLGYPGQKVYQDNDVCPKGSPDAGKQGVVIVQTWPNFDATKSTEVPGDPTDLKFADGQMITMAFVPATATVPKPQASAITALINVSQGSGTTQTTAAPSLPSTASTVPTPSTPTTAAK